MYPITNERHNAALPTFDIDFNKCELGKNVIVMQEKFQKIETLPLKMSRRKTTMGLTKAKVDN